MITKAQLHQVVTSKGFAVGVTAVVTGAVTYWATREHYKSTYEELMTAEAEELRLHYAQVYKRDEFSDPSELAKKYDVEESDEVVKAGVELLEEYKERTTDYRSSFSGEYDEVAKEVVEPKPDPVKELNALYEKLDEEGLSGTPFDLEAELQTRDTNEPYVISFEEWLADDFQHDQLSITYYEEDDVLADSESRPIDDVLGNVGDRCLSNFGLGSKDPNVVYVRNEKRGLDFEILLDHGSYEAEVLGIQHSAYRGKTPKFRGDDE